MSWEVLTMRSVTSFFNPALARSNLRRHWPILFLYTAIWLVALPVQLYLRHIAEGASYGTRTVSEVCQGTYSMGVIMAFVFGGVLAMALYSYLMNGRSVGLIHSLPLKRQTLFFTQLLTGFAMLTAGNLLVVLVSLLVCGEPGPLLVWLAVVTLAEIFFLALGTLCAMLTGWLLAVPVLYVGINFLVMAVMQLIHWLAELFIFGYQGDGFGSFTLWCTPVVQLARRLTDSQGVVAEYVGYPIVSADVNPLENGGWQALGIYAAVAVAILALACLLCIRRRSELSGDVAAFPWMRPVLRYGVGCIGGLALGMILYSVTFGLARTNDIRAYLPGMLLCVVLMTLVCSFGMSMLLGKSLKFPPHLEGYGAAGGAAGSGVRVRADGCGRCGAPGAKGRRDRECHRSVQKHSALYGHLRGYRDHRGHPGHPPGHTGAGGGRRRRSGRHAAYRGRPVHLDPPEVYPHRRLHAGAGL